MDFTKFDLPVLPVFSEMYADGKTNILFVGRVIPNKKIEDVIKAFHLYQTHFNPESRLFIVGEYRGFERYLTALQGLIAGLGVRDVHFSGHVPLAEVVSYAKLSHLYLHLSEHEGFCAPVVESFHLGIPVVAFDAGAVGETMNNGGVRVVRKDLLRVAALCHEILSAPALRAAILAGQERALEKYRRQRTGSILLDFLRARPAPRP
jgi:glycosyltransferase involved in cell wall biosynthesis